MDQASFFSCGYPVAPVLLVKETVLSPLNDFGTLMLTNFWAHNSLPLIPMSILMKYYSILITAALQ